MKKTELSFPLILSIIALLLSATALFNTYVIINQKNSSTRIIDISDTATSQMIITSSEQIMTADSLSNEMPSEKAFSDDEVANKLFESLESQIEYFDLTSINVENYQGFVGDYQNDTFVKAKKDVDAFSESQKIAFKVNESSTNKEMIIKDYPIFKTSDTLNPVFYQITIEIKGE